MFVCLTTRLAWERPLLEVLTWDVAESALVELTDVFNGTLRSLLDKYSFKYSDMLSISYVECWRWDVIAI